METYQDIFLKLIKENEDKVQQQIRKNPKFIEEMMNFSVKNISKQFCKNTLHNVILVL